MEAILDTNFIIACVKRKIDFLEDLGAQGFKVLVPRDVLEELKDLRHAVTHTERDAIDVALTIFEKRKVKKMKLPKGSVDAGLIALGKRGAYIATLDAGIKRMVKNTITINSSRNQLIPEQT
ncbi:hypothetical protein HYZ97_03545 [Candidatus Pacearchaeota archaeon]|nr:hypothetical protein [Candidatus Pacearchaeota archaeon]